MSAVVLVTGGAGYIGSHACKALAQAGHIPVTLDNMSLGHAWAVRFGPLVRGDLRDEDALDQAFRWYAPDAVMHFAGLSNVAESVVRPAAYYDNNVGGAQALLEAMRRHGCKSIIFSSTCATYGLPQAAPMPDDHPQAPINPYGRTKLMVERLLAHYEESFGVNHVALRYFNAAGAEPEAGLGEAHNPETHLIPLAVMAALGLRGALNVFGTDYDTPDGTAVRDYIHVADLARAHVLAMDWLLAGEPSQAMNLGTGCGHSVLEVIQAVERATGRSVPAVDRPRRAGDPPMLVASAQRAAERLGWRPNITRLEDMVDDARRFLERKTRVRAGRELLAAVG
ncbi:MAG: UDP-glucose 4-epimerase GalE [Desulfovibrionaceae bacterium]